MFKEIAILFIFFISFLGSAQDLAAIRSQYPAAVGSVEITSKLNAELSTVNASSKPELLAYKGAVLTLMGKFAKRTKDKKEFFKEGVSLIEAALNKATNNIEIHYIRLGVQENSPRFLGYHKNIEEDKKVITDNYATVSSKNLKTIIKNFILKSENFTDGQKQLFK